MHPPNPTPSTPAAPTLTLAPAAARWVEVARAAGGGVFALTEEAARFRRQLGLPTDRPIMLSGHQAWIWHGGILAKWMALSAAAEAAGAAAAWLTVDHDAVDPWAVRYPLRTGDGGMRGGVWRLDGQARAPTPDAPAFLRSPLRTVAPPPAPADGAGFADTQTPGALDAIAGAVEEVKDSQDAAGQVDGALRALIRRFVPGSWREPLALRSSRLGATDLFGAMVERLRADPVRAARAYNVAAGAHPAAGIQPLGIAGGQAELPLWRIVGEGGRAARVRVHSSDVAGVPVDRLLPRALFMTALLRLAGCEVFIHGVGGAGSVGANEADGPGGGYDAITDGWIEGWLGPGLLAPVVLATATLRLPLDAGAATPDSIARAAWTAHQARHDPALLGDPAAGDRKRDLIDRIAALRGLPERAGERLGLYRELHALLEGVRAKHAVQLEGFDARAAAARAQLKSARVAADRTWPFPLHAGGEGLASLAAEVRRAFSPSIVVENPVLQHPVRRAPGPPPPRR